MNCKYPSFRFKRTEILASWTVRHLQDAVVELFKGKVTNNGLRKA